MEEMVAVLKKAAAALRDAGVPYALAGGFALWTRGAPPSAHDVDFVLKEEDVERALAALEAAGLRTDDPPEGWLVKAWAGDVMVDLIFRPNGQPVDDDLLDRADEIEVEAMSMKVLLPEDVLAAKLLALSEHSLDFAGVLEPARSLREQVDWDDVREKTSSSPFARAFFTMAEGLDIVPTAADVSAGGRDGR